jgi:sugar phosphate isomerase/epimerase
MDRRKFGILASGLAIGACRDVASDSAVAADPSPTRFPIACMTLPYSAFSWERALDGIQRAGFGFVAWGTTHRDGAAAQPVIAEDGTLEHARMLARQCRDRGLEPLMMFSMIYPEAPRALEVLTHRISQAEAANIPQLLTFGHTDGGRRDVWIDRFKRLGKIARDHGVTIVVKQHGGETGTGKACAEIVREVNDPAIMVNYDAGNVMDYLNVDPLPDIKACADVVRSFCMKDHRNWPNDEDCAPGYGEIDHYRLLDAVRDTGRAIPLCCENIAAPLIPRPTMPDQIDRMAQRTREFLETVVRGLGQVVATGQ